MKKLLALLLCSVVTFSAALALGYDDMSSEDIYAEIGRLANEAGRRIAEEEGRLVTEEYETLRDIFDDVELAKRVRDACGLVSIDQPVTQDKLDTVDMLYMYWVEGYGQITSLKGIERLRNLHSLDASGMRLLESFPREVLSLTGLMYLDLSDTGIKDLPCEVITLKNLVSLNVSRTNIAELPDGIGSLVNLRELHISNTKITTLPDSIYLLDLDVFSKSGLDIE